MKFQKCILCVLALLLSACGYFGKETASEDDTQPKSRYVELLTDSRYWLYVLSPSGSCYETFVANRNDLRSSSLGALIDCDDMPQGYELLKVGQLPQSQTTGENQ